MKMTMPSGSVLIINPRNFLHRGHHDSAWLHGIDVGFPAASECGSGRIINVFYATLKSGEKFYYPYFFSDSYAAGSDFRKLMAQAVSPFPPAMYDGETFNLWARKLVFDKVAEVDYPAWKLAH